MRENRTYGSEGGEAKKPSLPLSARHLGRLVVPIKNASIARAQRRPSRIAQTTSDWLGAYRRPRARPAARSDNLWCWLAHCRVGLSFPVTSADVIRQ
jgi:hypothetical protein